MKRAIVRLFAVVLVIGSVLLSGCEKKEESDSKVPWARPAGWEGGMPGFGSAPY